MTGLIELSPTRTLSPHSAMLPEFPQELIDEAIDCLTDPGDHLRCSLVCHSWLPRAQSHIFHTVSLGVGLGGGSAPGLVDIPPLGTNFDNFERFDKLLQGSPHLALHIKTLNLGLQPSQSELPLTGCSWQSIEDFVLGFFAYDHMRNNIRVVSMWARSTRLSHTTPHFECIPCSNTHITSPFPMVLSGPFRTLLLRILATRVFPVL